MGILSKINSALGRHSNSADTVSKSEEPQHKNNTRSGTTVNSENIAERIYNELYISPDYKLSVYNIREMDRVDPRVKRIHRKMARDATKNGIRLRNVVSGLRMPAETILPDTLPTGQLKSIASAYKQLDPVGGYQIIANFAFWQLAMGRIDPDNYDDFGCPGRPYLDATRKTWRQLQMTEDDLVIRRRTRAPQRFSHVLDGATAEELAKYKSTIESNKGLMTTDFYANHKGGVTGVNGDANLDQINDVVHLLDTFFSGAPAPKGLFGYSEGLSRDILEDLKKDYFEEIEGLQDTISQVYFEGFRLQLLLAGINPDSYNFNVQFTERKTETRNQKADLALKYQALGVPDSLVWETAGFEPAYVMDKIKDQKRSGDPYPGEEDDEDGTSTNDNPKPRVTVTPNNQPKGESATYVQNA